MFRMTAIMYTQVVGAAQLHFGKNSNKLLANKLKWRNGIEYVSLVQYTDWINPSDTGN